MHRLLLVSRFQQQKSDRNITKHPAPFAFYRHSLLQQLFFYRLHRTLHFLRPAATIHFSRTSRNIKLTNSIRLCRRGAFILLLHVASMTYHVIGESHWAEPFSRNLAAVASFPPYPPKCELIAVQCGAWNWKGALQYYVAHRVTSVNQSITRLTSPHLIASHSASDFLP